MSHKRIVEESARSPAGKSHFSPNPKARPFVPETNRVQFTSSAKRQRQAAIFRSPYKGSRVTKILSDPQESGRDLATSQQDPIYRGSMDVVDDTSNLPRIGDLPVTEGEADEESRESAVVEDKHGLLHSVLTPPNTQQALEVLRVKKSDKYGHIYQARANTTLYEIRVYSFSQENAPERRQAKRNCREWKARRRFLSSWKQNNLIFLILRNQGDYSENTSLHSAALERSVISKEDVIAKYAREYVMSQKLNVYFHPSPLFLPCNGTKTNAQKERARKVQQKRRTAKRTSRRAIEPYLDIEQDQPGISPNQNDFTALHSYDASSTSWNPFYIYGSLAAESSNLWVPYNGWVAVNAFGNHGSYMYDSGNQTSSPSPYYTVDRSTHLSPEKETPCERTATEKDGTPATNNDPTTNPYPDLTVDRSGHLPLEKKTPFEKEAAEKDDEPANNGESTSNPPAELLDENAPLAAESPRKDGSADVSLEALWTQIKVVLEELFSFKNLCKDNLLREQMDCSGFVPLSFLATLKEVNRLTKETSIILSSCNRSYELEVKAGEVNGRKAVLLRRKAEWEKWLLFEQEENMKQEADKTSTTEETPREPRQRSLPHKKRPGKRSRYKIDWSVKTGCGGRRR